MVCLVRNRAFLFFSHFHAVFRDYLPWISTLLQNIQFAICLRKHWSLWSFVFLSSLSLAVVLYGQWLWYTKYYGLLCDGVNANFWTSVWFQVSINYGSNGGVSSQRDSVAYVGHLSYDAVMSNIFLLGMVWPILIQTITMFHLYQIIVHTSVGLTLRQKSNPKWYG